MIYGLLIAYFAYRIYRDNKKFKKEFKRLDAEYKILNSPDYLKEDYRIENDTHYLIYNKYGVHILTEMKPVGRTLDIINELGWHD